LVLAVKSGANEKDPCRDSREESGISTTMSAVFVWKVAYIGAVTADTAGLAAPPFDERGSGVTIRCRSANSTFDGGAVGSNRGGS